MKPDFWETLEALIARNGFVIDRPKGSLHPRFPAVVYPVDYGYIPGTSAADRQGIDIFAGSAPDKRICGLLCTFDGLKKDAEIKILHACTEEEMREIHTLLNGDPMTALLVRQKGLEKTATE